MFVSVSPFNTVGALERAKYAVESQYAVVGVLEDLNTTLSVFEKYIPKFFKGASEVYYGIQIIIKIKNYSFEYDNKFLFFRSNKQF